MKIVLATHNPGKLREFRALLAPAHWELIGLADLSIGREAEETGSSFAENARMKALQYTADTNLPVLADDSGLEVFSLGRRPGIESARYAGAGVTDGDRINKLLAEMAQAGSDRSARFVCALALAQRGRIILEAEGECSGEIAWEPRGTNGFGYDPIFWMPQLSKTFAELTDTEKNLHSHRSHATRALLKLGTDHDIFKPNKEI